MNKNNNICNNCGKIGHLFHQCKLPVTSYGIILIRNSEKGNQLLMIRRKDSFGYIDFIRGKYSSNNIEQIQSKIDEMSVEEKQKIINESFPDLWKQLWGDNQGAQYRSEEVISSKKFETIKNGVFIEKEKLLNMGYDVKMMLKEEMENSINMEEEKMSVFEKNNTKKSFIKIILKNIVENSKTNLLETEWEFPKGRRNHQEKDLECAMREFEEETGYSRENIKIIDNLLPFEEIFIGSNYKLYRNKYYLAYMTEKLDLLNSFQPSEVSKLEWKTKNECLESIRPYNLEKKKIILNINKLLEEYRLYL